MTLLMVGFLGGSIGVAGACQSLSEDEARHQRAAEELERHRRFQAHLRERLDYFQDERTGLCFALLYGHKDSSIASVPCETVKARLR